MKNLIKMFLAIAAMIIISSCKSQVDEKPFEFNGESFETIVRNAISGDENSKNILDGLFTFDTKLKTFNKIDVDSIEINNINYYTLLLENQNPVYNLFAVVDKNMNLILKDESLNGYLKLNFKKSGSRRFAVVTENFNSKDVIELNRVSYYLLEQYSSDLVFRQFIKIKTPSKEAEQVISVISDTAIITSIFYPAAKNSKTSKDVFRFDVATDRYLSANNLFDSLVVKEIRSLNIQTKNPQITDGESILRFFNNGQNVSDLGNVKLSEKDFVIDLDSTWKKLGSVTISNLVKQKVTGSKYISGKMGASISLAAIAPTDSAENYFNETLNNKYQYNSSMRSSDKLIDNKNIYQLYEFSCPTKKI
ncbi:MAG: hypothetical protein IT276_04965, partial [Ignavibacteriaceae bacterium]|nr:hypothetical protein [Ignavibacteriaceae bacterium]HRN27968.1 hypothetical protein [Ignavibacteriaceae bacterium]HRQ55724.1 hypothetical protein [Ignavibacteriaceae bacterium]